MPKSDDTTLSLLPEPGSCAGEHPVTTLRIVYAQGVPWDDPLLDRLLVLRTGGGRSLRVGRKPPGDAGDEILALPRDSWASRSHARLTALGASAGGAVAVEDLGSRNGTSVAGKRVRGSAIARVGDVVRVGGTLLVVGRVPLQRAEAIRRDHPVPDELDARAWPALQLWERLCRLAGSDAGVLLLGEMGTGKTRLARWIHRLGE